MNVRFLKKLRVMGMIEGTSTLILFGVAMPLKYFAGMPLAVTLVGSIHGALFIGLVGMCLVAIKKVPIGAKLGASGIIGAVFPFGPFIVDHWLKKLETENSKTHP